MKPWQRIVGARANGAGGSHAGVAAEADGNTRGAFDELRQSLAAELEREPGSPLLLRASLEMLLGAFLTSAQQRRGAVGLVAFELEDWKTHHERAGEPAFASVFTDLGRELRRRVRASDELGRLGEAQIAAILPGCERESLDGVSERLRLALEALDLSLGREPFRPALVTAWLAAPPGPGTTTPARLLEVLAHALERARDAVAG